MKTKKMSLANIQGKLSRAEMKKIMAGSGGACPYTACDLNCNSQNNCKCYGGGTSNAVCDTPH